MKVRLATAIYDFAVAYELIQVRGQSPQNLARLITKLDEVHANFRAADEAHADGQTLTKTSGRYQNLLDAIFKTFSQLEGISLAVFIESYLATLDKNPSINALLDRDTYLPVSDHDPYNAGSKLGAEMARQKDELVMDKVLGVERSAASEMLIDALLGTTPASNTIHRKKYHEVHAERLPPYQPCDTLQDMQRHIGAWSQYNFGLQRSKKSHVLEMSPGGSSHQPVVHSTGMPLGSLAPLLGIGEEYGELLHVTLKAHQGIRGYDDPVKYITERDDAVADILVYLCDYCSREGIDLFDVFQKTFFKVVCKRDWQVSPEKAAEEAPQNASAE